MTEQEQILQLLKNELKEATFNQVIENYLEGYIFKQSNPIARVLELCHELGQSNLQCLSTFLSKEEAQNFNKIFKNSAPTNMVNKIMSYLSHYTELASLFWNYHNLRSTTSLKSTLFEFESGLPPLMDASVELSKNLHLPPAVSPNSSKKPEQQYKLPGENPLYFTKRAVEGRGDCAFLALNSTREKFIEVLSKNTMTDDERESIWMEICEVFSSNQYSSYLPEPLRREFCQIQENEEEWANGRMFLINAIKEKDPIANAIDGDHFDDFLNHVAQADPGAYQELTDHLSTENNAPKREFFTREDVIAAYLSLFNHGLWGGVASLALYAKLSNINLTIYSVDNENNLKTIKSHFSREATESFHILFHQSSTHFDQLILQESAERPSKKRKTGHETGCSVTISSLQEGMSFVGPLLKKEQDDLNFLISIFSLFPSDQPQRKRGMDEGEEPNIEHISSILN